MALQDEGFCAALSFRMAADLTNPIIAYQAVLVLVGAVLLWRYFISPSSRMRRGPSPLPTWEGQPSDLLMFLLLVIAGAILGGLVAASASRMLKVHGDAATLVAGAGAQFGMFLGVAGYASYSPQYRWQARQSFGTIVGSGFVTFAIACPILYATSYAWETLLQLFGLPAEPQDLIRMFADAKSPKLMTGLIVLATVVAPIVEESIFRAGIFRFLRTRAPRALALLLPAVLFAALHVDWSTLTGFASFAPLLVLALIFSVAYEQTGNIATTMIAHALFNLNTIILILAGATS